MVRRKWPLDHVEEGERVFQAEGKSKYAASEVGLEQSRGR